MAAPARQTSLLVGCVSRTCGAASPSAWKRPGWHLKVSKEKCELTAISRPESVWFLWSWHPSLFRNATRLRSSLRFTKKSFYAQPGRPCPGTPTKKRDWKPPKKPGKDLSALLFFLCTVWVERFSCSNLPDVTGCVLPNPELRVSGNRARPLAAAAAPPTGRGSQCKAHTSTINKLKMQVFLLRYWFKITVHFH